MDMVSCFAHHLVSIANALPDEPFKERLDGTLRRSLSGTWSSHAMEPDTSAASTDGSHTLVDSQLNTALPAVNEEAELKRRQDFTKNWKEQQAGKSLIELR